MSHVDLWKIVFFHEELRCVVSMLRPAVTDEGDFRRACGGGVCAAAYLSIQLKARTVKPSLPKALNKPRETANSDFIVYYVSIIGFKPSAGRLSSMGD